ncbi:hypothetical protein WR25_10359 [Diploscapter pachys]|uniref:Uncharacterized protein n=1 Tax=Diploscapter pachys TaxID=2018661 RepID=A0A2A2JHF7_9BILA|nr:hypothetical protein WR25_10359 [Diploscapter pachys]
MSDDDDAMALREIKWKTLVLGQRQPTELTEGQEWTSQSSDKYPIDIVLALDNVCNVYKLLELTQAFTDAFGQYVWLVVHEPIKHRTNPTEIATIHKITVLGYPLTDREKSKIRKKNLGIEDERSEGIKTTSEGMGGDALSSLRVVRNALAEKMHRSNKIGKTVEASMCKRAIQRLDEYEGKIKDLAVRRNNALVVGDDEMAQRHQLGMQDCRDTAMRTAHVDLLLGRDELKAIGVQSDWTE